MDQPPQPQWAWAYSPFLTKKPPAGARCRRTGKIIWELGGKQSTFTLKAAPGQVLDRAGEIFAFQHDPEVIGDGEYTVFDDESDGSTTLLRYSRVVTVKLDLATRVATLVRSVDQPEGLAGPAEGNAQTTRNGDLFVDWGGPRVKCPLCALSETSVLR